MADNNNNNDNSNNSNNSNSGNLSSLTKQQLIVMVQNLRRALRVAKARNTRLEREERAARQEAVLARQHARAADMRIRELEAALESAEDTADSYSYRYGNIDFQDDDGDMGD